MQGVEGSLGRLQLGIELVHLILGGQPEIEAETDALPTAYQLDTGQHEAAGTEPLPAGLCRIERQAAVVAGAVFTARIGEIADSLDILWPGQLVDGAERHILRALGATGLPIDAGVEGLRRQPAREEVDVGRHAQPHETADSAVTQGVQLLLEMGLSQHGCLV